MNLKQGEINNIKFFYREGYSDLKTFIEVIKNKAYLKKNMKINTTIYCYDKNKFKSN